MSNILDLNMSVTDVKMVEDFLNQILPVLGFISCVVSAFTMIALRPSKGAYRFVAYIAIFDFLSGLSSIYAGLRGVVTTVYEDVNRKVSPWSCIPGAMNVLGWQISDGAVVFLLSAFVLDRLVFILVPVNYHKFAGVYIRVCMPLMGLIAGMVSVLPALQFAKINQDNESVGISILCRYEEFVGEKFYLHYITVLQWMPCSGLVVMLVFGLMYFCRHQKQKWCYNWSEERSDTKQMVVMCSVRCFLAALSVHLPLLLISQEGISSHALIIKDYLFRISHMIMCPIIQPALYLVLSSHFSANVYLLFNKYRHNTERQWQAAGDPPKDDVEQRARDGDNPFGSWYSTTGNITGEAGIPIDRSNQRSVSFYYDSPVLEKKSPPQPQKQQLEKH